MIYVASPYSSPEPTVRDQRFRLARKYVAHLLGKKIPAFSPIAYCHDISQLYNLPTDAGYWHHVNEQFLRVSESMHVLCIPGWENSVGVQYEIGFMTARDRPITYIELAEYIHTTSN